MLDVSTRAAVLSTLDGLRRGGEMGILLITHDPFDGWAVCRPHRRRGPGTDRRAGISARRPAPPRASLHEGAAVRRPTARSGRPTRAFLRGETSDPMNVAAVAASILAAERAAELRRGRLRAPSTRTRRRASIALPASPSDQDQFIDHVGLVPVRTARVCTLLRMQRERLTVSMEPQTAARVRECGTRTRGGASAYLEHLVRQDALREAATSAASWYAAHPTYAADSEAETLAALDEIA